MQTHSLLVVIWLRLELLVESKVTRVAVGALILGFVVINLVKHVQSV